MRAEKSLRISIEKIKERIHKTDFESVTPKYEEVREKHKTVPKNEEVREKHKSIPPLILPNINLK